MKKGFKFDILHSLYLRYWETYGSWIAIGADIEEVPTFPHGPVGVFISRGAHIGKRCVIFHQVTIGSNALKDSKNNGAPWVDDDVYIGCGAKIIGNVIVGHHSRIGANCVVVKNTPPHSVTVIRCIESIVKKECDNSFEINTKRAVKTNLDKFNQ